MKIAKAWVMQAYNAVGEHFGNHQSMGKNVYAPIACNAKSHYSETSHKAVYGTALKTSLQLVRSLVG